MTANEIITAARAALESRKDRSAWDRAVTADAIDLLDNITDAVTYGYITADDITDAHILQIKRAMLSGADNWHRYSWSGCALCYDGDIAAHYCTPSELKRTRNGQRRPNRDEEWLDVQARALGQAATRAYRAIKRAAGIPA